MKSPEKPAKRKARRKLRGSDFLMRWSQGAWSEDQLVEAVNRDGSFYALPYGPSGAAPDDVEEYEKYFERLEAAGLGKIKRPDLLIFSSKDKERVQQIVKEISGIREIPFHSEKEDIIKRLLEMAIVAVECENSLWVAKKMPNYEYVLKPQKRLNGKLGLAKTAVLPTIILKDEDMGPLVVWQELNPEVPLHIWHAFFDEAYGISFGEILKLIGSGDVQGQVYEFANAGQSSTKKTLYKVPYYFGYKLASSQESPELKAQSITDKNGHIYPYVTFTGGKVKLDETAQRVLKDIQFRVK